MLEALTNRNRYLRAATWKYGYGLPLTSSVLRFMTSSSV